MLGILSLLLSMALLASAAEVNFRRDKPGTVPKGWVVAMTHEGGAPKWEIVEDPTAPSPSRVLAQTSSDSTSGRFPLAIYQAAFTDGSVSVRFKPVSGERDQAAGIVGATSTPATTTSLGPTRLRTMWSSTKSNWGSGFRWSPKERPPRPTA